MAIHQFYIALYITSLDGFELEFDHFAADCVAEIVFPEAAEAGELVYQELEAQIAPQSKEFHADRDLAEAGGRVVPVAAVVRAEVAERKTVEMPAVGWVAEGTEVGVVRRDNQQAAV